MSDIGDTEANIPETETDSENIAARFRKAVDYAEENFGIPVGTVAEVYEDREGLLCERASTHKDIAEAGGSIFLLTAVTGLATAGYSAEAAITWDQKDLPAYSAPVFLATAFLLAMAVKIGLSIERSVRGEVKNFKESLGTEASPSSERHVMSVQGFDSAVLYAQQFEDLKGTDIRSAYKDREDLLIDQTADHEILKGKSGLSALQALAAGTLAAGAGIHFMLGQNYDFFPHMFSGIAQHNAAIIDWCLAGAGSVASLSGAFFAATKTKEASSIRESIIGEVVEFRKLQKHDTPAPVAPV